MDSDGDFADIHHHYHSIPPVSGQKPMIAAVPLIPHPSYQSKFRYQKAVNTNPLQRFFIYESTAFPFRFPHSYQGTNQLKCSFSR